MGRGNVGEEKIGVWLDEICHTVPVSSWHLLHSNPKLVEKHLCEEWGYSGEIMWLWPQETCHTVPDRAQKN